MAALPPDPKVVGKWGDVFKLQNVAVHASLLPTGKVLYWGRRSNPQDTTAASMNEHFTNAFLWDPSVGKTGESKATTTQPKLLSGDTVNLFCSGHCFQADGTLLVVGGHLFDGQGVNQAGVYDPIHDTWTAKSLMNNGRWYPSALTLNDGSGLAISGSYHNDADGSNPQNNIPQIWRANAWVSMPAPPSLESYPRLHLDPSGQVFMSGPQPNSLFLNTDGLGTWTATQPTRFAGSRDYAPSVLYASGKIDDSNVNHRKIMFIGGGLPPTNIVEFIDLNDVPPSWTHADTTNMTTARRHHNATVLPDGTVLVNGGTSGAGSDPGPDHYEFNDVTKAVHKAALWNPFAKPPQWTDMAEEEVDRCYHSIALLLPDGRVLSAGGGEWCPDEPTGLPNAPKDSHVEAQLYSPPYLFNGTPPTVSSAPTEIDYKQEFEVTVGASASDSIARVSWIRLGSVTHACNMNQSLTFLAFKQQGTKVTVEAPADSNAAPPGHYMLFLLNQQGVPAVAPIIRIGPASTQAATTSVASTAQPTALLRDDRLSHPELNERIIAEQDRPAVAVGLTSMCPYGLGPCWGGAYDGLRRISEIDVVRPVPNHTHSIAYVYLKQDTLPDIDVWRSEFAKTANKSYHMRGIEMTLSGVVGRKRLGTDEQLIMAGTSIRPEVSLAPFQAASKLELDKATKAPGAVSDTEVGAYARLSAAVADHTPPAKVQVTGRLHKHGAHQFSIDVREFAMLDNAGAS